MVSRPSRLLFVCTGNICRSPMAEHLARAVANEHGVSLEVRSAGTLGLVDRPAEPKMVAVGREIGLDLSTHRSQPLSAGLVDWADRILVMEHAHYGHVQEFFPGSSNKVELLGRYGGFEEIDDPIGSWFTWTYRRCRDRLHRCVEGLIADLPLEVRLDGRPPGGATPTSGA